MQSKFVSKFSFITLNFACKDCKVFIWTSCMFGKSLYSYTILTLILIPSAYIFLKSNECFITSCDTWFTGACLLQRQITKQQQTVWCLHVRSTLQFQTRQRRSYQRLGYWSCRYVWNAIWLQNGYILGLYINRLITAYLLLRVNCDKIMHACWDFYASSAQTWRLNALPMPLDKHQSWSESNWCTT